jgi:hypothetical protein
MEGNAKIRRRRKETLLIEGEFGYNNVTLNDQTFENLRGTTHWDNRNKQVIVDAFLDDGPLKSHLNVYSRRGLTRIRGEKISAEKITKVIKIDNNVPLGGIVTKADLNIKRRIFSGTASLEPWPENENRTAPETPQTVSFNIKGDIKFRHDGKKKSVEFSTENAETEFGKLNFLEGEVDPKKETSLRIKARANVNRMGWVNKYTDYYINLDLNRWNLRKGNGFITLDLKKTGKKLFVESDVDIRDLTTSGQPIGSLSGHISTKGSLTSGTFTVKDKDLTGNAEMFIGKDYFTIDFKDIEGESLKVMKILEIDLSLSGWMKGNFNLYKKDNEPFPLVKGNFQARRINFYDFYFDNIKGELEYQENITLKGLDYFYNGGKGTADIYIDYDKEIYSLEGEIKGIDVNRLQSAFNGQGDIYFRGDGVFDKDPIRVSYGSGDLYFYDDRAFNVKGTGKIFTDFTDFRIDAQGDVLNVASASPFTFRLNKTGDNYSGSLGLTLTDINLLIPWGNNSGTMELEGQILENDKDELSMEGRAVFNGRVFSFPNFPHALENFRGEVIFKDLSFTLRSADGTMGGGEVEAGGYLNIKDNKLDDLFINFTGRNMNLYPIDRTNFTLNADLNLKYIDEKLILSGQMDALSAIWRRELDEGVSFNTDPSLSPSGSKIMDMLEFDLKLTGSKDIEVDNSFGKARGEFDLKLTGNTDFPILTGVIECREGEINFSDKKFDLVRAKIVFNNKFIIDPRINIESESFIKNYRVKFNIRGLSSRLKPELQSIPPLPPGDIMTLISLGELFERPTSAELSSRIGTVTTGLLAAEVTDAIKKRTRKLFGDFMLNIDPNISSIGDVSESRLIVGKEISKDFMVVMATNFQTQRQQSVVYLQYQLTPSISLIGMRNAEGYYSLDLRLRKRR